MANPQTHGFAVGYILTPLRGWELTPSTQILHLKFDTTVSDMFTSA